MFFYFVVFLFLNSYFFAFLFFLFFYYLLLYLFSFHHSIFVFIFILLCLLIDFLIILFHLSGVQGAKALMAIPMAVGDRVLVTSSGCNIEIVDPNCWFNLSHPCGAYNLNLSKPYDRAVSFALLRLVAGHQKIDITGRYSIV